MNQKIEKTTVRVLDNNNWAVVRKTKKSEAVLKYRKNLLEALSASDESINLENEYNEALKQFTLLVQSQIKKESTGEYSLSYNKSTVWYHRDKERIIHSFFEFTLKKLCLSGKSYVEAIKESCLVSPFQKQEVA